MLLIKSNRKKRIIIIVLFCLIIGIIFIPYEAPFIRFDSPEASVKYSTIKGNLPLYVVEGKNTAFTLQNSGNCSILYIDYFSLLAFKNIAIIQIYIQVFGSISIPINGSACENSTTGI